MNKKIVTVNIIVLKYVIVFVTIKTTPTECIYNTLRRLIFLNYQLNLGSIRNLQIFLTQLVCRRYCVQLAVSSMEVQMYTSEPFACSRGGRCTRTCRHRSPGGHPRVG